MTDVDHSQVMERARRVMAHASDVMARLDEGHSPAKDAARRERQRLNAGLGRTTAKIAAALVLIWLAAVIIGLIKPIGMVGFIAALVASAIVAALLIARGGRQVIGIKAPPTDLPNGAMVERFDSYLYRVRPALPRTAQAQIDAISSVLPSLRQTLGRVGTLDPNAQDARRLMSIHLPGLIDRYTKVPPAYRQEKGGEDKSVDERLVEGLAAARTAFEDISEQLARSDMAAFETQGRFIQSRYGTEPIDR